MASFTDRYLNFNHDGRRSPSTTALLWPVWVWEILAPKTNGTRLNLFQRTLLGLFNCDQYDRKQIAQWMGIEEEMVVYIIASQLIPNGWLNNQGVLTEKGLALLNKDRDLKTDLTFAYVFQDAITGKYWPRVSQELLIVEPQCLNSRGSPEFTTDRNSGFRDIPFVVPCHKTKPPQQNLKSMWQAVQQGNIAIHNQNVRGELESEIREFSSDEIECIEHLPSKAYVMCWVIKDPVLQWTVTDPLAVERSCEDLRVAVFDEAKKNKGLAQKLKQYLGDITEEETVESLNLRIHEEAKFELLIEYQGAERVPHLEKYLIALLRRTQKLEQSHRPFAEDWEELLTQSQKIFECCFKWMLIEWPIKRKNFIHSNWQHEDIYNALNSIAGELISEDALRNLSRQKAGSIHFAATKNENTASLRPLIAAALFCLTEYDDHLLRSLNEQGSLNLDIILEIADKRNKIAHASGGSLSLDDAVDYAQFTKKWVADFLKELK